nr:putative wax ester synthase/acyl-CoA:diacylglycerol acyltransferase [uncultured bacterium]
MKYLNQMDAVFLRMDAPGTPMHAGCLLTFKLPKGAPKDFMRTLLNGMRKAPMPAPFCYKLASTRLVKIAPAWVDAPDLDPTYHIRHSALPAPGGERDLGELIARLHSAPVDLARPLWEVHLIEGLENRRFAVYVKAHHACADGATAMRNIGEWLTIDPENKETSRSFAGATEPQTADKKKPGKPRRVRRSPLSKAIAQLTAVPELLGALAKMNRRSSHPEGGFYSAMETPRTPFNAPVTAQRRLATQRYDFQRFKALSEATGTSINDIVLTVTGGAIRRYLIEGNALPKKTLIASVPVAIKSSNKSGGNAVAGFVVPLGTDRSDPLQRLKRIHAVTSRTKEELQALSSEAVMMFAGVGFMPMLLGQATGLNAVMPRLTNITVSNVPGPKERRYLCGAEMEAIYPVGLLFDGYAINLTLVSYAGQYCFSYLGCRDALPHLQRLAVYTGKALEDLEKKVGL